MSWTLLPTELRLYILRHHLASTEIIDHAMHLDNLVCGDLEVLISTRNIELVRDALGSYYSSNTFVIRFDSIDKDAGERKVHRPRVQYAALMKRLIHETYAPGKVVVGALVLEEGEEKTMPRVDLGVNVQDSAAAEQPASTAEKSAEEKVEGEEEFIVEKKSVSYGLYWDLHSLKLNRSVKVLKLLERTWIELPAEGAKL